jgi:hypothetical protein
VFPTSFGWGTSRTFVCWLLETWGTVFGFKDRLNFTCLSWFDSIDSPFWDVSENGQFVNNRAVNFSVIDFFEWDLSIGWFNDSVWSLDSRFFEEWFRNDWFTFSRIMIGCRFDRTLPWGGKSLLNLIGWCKSSAKGWVKWESWIESSSSGETGELTFGK